MIGWISLALIAVGAFFFLAGSTGVLRFPDVYTRLHALTKADNLGLGFVVLGLSLRADSWIVVLKMLLIWSLVIVAGATASHLVAEAARMSNVPPWRKRS
ncbi:MAG: monovalent cation/H(+) antiporter subunit G [Anaerosomatales bacterium]|nr:monovalent cation/H(+) antiporter subunit G [Anaerosomatales bacterium]MDT8433694.1 monovalent cation/H(+) antiporter subunit G [Anaerosomatales bacterium]